MRKTAWSSALAAALVALPLVAGTAAQRMAIARAAEAQVGVTVVYDPSYVSLRYPGGDLPRNRGVCADVIVRALRDAVSVDLQRELHEDMRAHFGAYPRMWGLRAPDTNIDHRRVPNLMTYFVRRGLSVNGAFEPGDIVAFRLPGGFYHIGIIATDGRNVIHNIGRGAQREDVLGAFPVIGHYRF